jgi:hypothetical protein
MLFLLLFIPVVGFAQSDASIEAFLKSRPQNLGKLILLPKESGIPHYYQDGTRGWNQAFIYVISSDSIYRELFSLYRFTHKDLEKFKVENDTLSYQYYARYLIDSLPEFDFSRQELVLYIACGQCLNNCDHHGKAREPCHRNACHLQKAWYLRDKKVQLIVSN